MSGEILKTSRQFVMPLLQMKKAHVRLVSMTKSVTEDNKELRQSQKPDFTATSGSAGVTETNERTVTAGETANVLER